MMYYWDNVVAIDIRDTLGPRPHNKKTHELECAFDTEATSFYDEDGNKTSLVYIWMFGYGDTVVYGRTLKEFAEFIRQVNEMLEEIPDRPVLRVYVHHLRYDFSHIRKYFKWDKVFLTDRREPLYAQTGLVRFQDSLILAGGKSLDYVGKHLRRSVLKATGTMDYNELRTPKTLLSVTELHYCEQDIRVLLEYIREKMEDEDTITKIPYTNTGYVRRFVKEECFKHRGDYLSMMDELTLTCDGYLLAEQCFRGGVTGPNLTRQHKVIDNVRSFDLKSAYPASIVTDYFPMSYFYPVTDNDANLFYRNYIDEYCCMFEVTFKNLMPTQNYQFPLSESKCKLKAGRVMNGRVISAVECTTWVTEVDFKSYQQFYTWEGDPEFTRFRIAMRGPLPKPIVMSVLKFFNDKTTLDGIPGKEEEYMLSKNMLNSVYGMMVMKVAREQFSYDSQHHDFLTEPKDYESDINKYNNKYDRFLYYPWGVWVTAHTRARLFNAIEAVGNDFLYCDTDAVYFTGSHDEYFTTYNKEQTAKLKDRAKSLRIDESYIIPTSPKGKVAILGTFEEQSPATRFKTIGPKRYLYETADGEYHLTVAGTNKAKTLEYILEQARYLGTDPFDIFKLGLVIPPEYAKRLVMTYIDEVRTGDMIDRDGVSYHYWVPSGVHMEAATYEFHEMSEMKEVLTFIIANAAMEEPV